MTHRISSTWRKATRSGNSGNCVEIRFVDDLVLVRDSKYLRDAGNDAARQPIIGVPARGWRTFLDGVLSGSAAGHPGLPSIVHHTDGQVSIIAGVVTLTYTPSEWTAFCDGIRNGEFDRVLSAA